MSGTDESVEIVSLTDSYIFQFEKYVVTCEWKILIFLLYIYIYISISAKRIRPYYTRHEFYYVTRRHFTKSARHSSIQSDVAHFRREHINYNNSVDLDIVDRFHRRDERKQDCV